ncbi:MAG TPA: methylated-DNA--[protein]-cysteine S-methyltransferase [Gammaproteobacteria bacterium]|nr:methylated-DNA--[protein]-cysteine S-methyltransferase [Gammaproteobacteria bacterium]
MSDYDRIAGAIDYIVAHADAQPGLAEVAAEVSLSPYHFQRLFARWVGLSPKRFLQVITVERAKRLLAENALPLLEASETLGLSSTSRLHDHFVRLEAVTPGEFRTAGEGLAIRYGTAASPFGRAFVAATERGICALAFLDEETEDTALESLARTWPRAALVADASEAAALAAQVFGRATAGRAPVSVFVRGTNFQTAVWRALLAIPEGKLASYGDVARAIGKPDAVRAVGTAVGANPCAFLIPCHRVIRGNGEIGGYRWGLTRKRAINIWEAAATDGMLPGC